MRRDFNEANKTKGRNEFLVLHDLLKSSVNS
jgi:hypothetical protein